MLTTDQPANGSRWRELKRFGNLSPRTRALMVAVAVLLAIFVLGQLANGMIGGPAPSGPDSSSYATTSSGLAAYETLVSQFGHPVQRVTTPLSKASAPAHSVIIIAHPSGAVFGEVPAIRRLLDSGDTVVLTGVRSVPTIQALLGPSRAPALSAAGNTLYYASSSALTSRHIIKVAATGSGSWSSAGSSRSLLRASGGSLAVTTRVGSGRLIMISDSSCLQNQFLDRQDNAAFGLYLAGRPGSTVVFDEYVHGYGVGSSNAVSAIPVRWKWGLLLAVLAALIWMWSRSRRLGDPEQAERALTPPRRRYVDSLALELSRASDIAEAAEPLRTAATRRIEARLGLRVPLVDETTPTGSFPAAPTSASSTPTPADPTSGPSFEASRTLGIPEEVMAAIGTRVSNERDLLALGRALAWLEGDRR